MLNPSDSVKSHIAEVALYMTSRHTISMKTHFCKYCGNRFEPWKNGRFLEDLGCEECVNGPIGQANRLSEYGQTISKFYYCIRCGKPLAQRNERFGHCRKLCKSCKSLITNERARKARKKDKERFDVYRLTKGNPEKITILYECPHNSNGRKKALHHPRYSKPYEVIALCAACHRKEHHRLKELERQEIIRKRFGE